jgi:hypothetical protein
LGFFDKLREFGDIIKDAKQDWKDNVAPAFQEVGETATDGFKEMVIKKNSNYQTSYEKVESANSIFSSAKRRHRDLSKQVNNFYEETNNLVKEHFQYKQELRESVLVKYQSQLINFSKLDLNQKLLAGSSVSGFQPIINATKMIGTGLALTGISSISRLNPALLGLSVAGWVYEKNKRVEAANEYLAEAKQFQSRVNVEMEKLRSLKSELMLIQNKIKEEKRLLHTLVNKLEQITVSLSTIVRKEKLSLEDKEMAEASILIASAINDALVTRFVNDSGKITSEYNKVLVNLKRLETLITERGI